MALKHPARKKRSGNFRCWVGKRIARSAEQDRRLRRALEIFSTFVVPAAGTLRGGDFYVVDLDYKGRLIASVVRFAPDIDRKVDIGRYVLPPRPITSQVPS